MTVHIGKNRCFAYIRMTGVGSQALSEADLSYSEEAVAAAAPNILKVPKKASIPSPGFFDGINGP